MDEWTESTLKAFKIYLEKLGRSENTVNSYYRSVRFFFSLYCELSIENLKSYREFLLKKYELNTVNTRIYGMNRYLEFLYKSGNLPESLMAISDSESSPDDGTLSDVSEELLPPPDVSARSDTNERPEPFFLPPVKVPDSKNIYRMQPVKEQKKTYLDTVISQRDYERLKRCLKRDGNFYWYFVVRFLGATGARISELLQIKIEDLRLGYLDLYSKGGKIRRLYFPRSLCSEAVPWFMEHGITSGFIFLNHHGKLITSRGISLQLKHLAVRYHINPDTVYPHSFRHRFAKNFLKKFNDISLLADLMGHDSIETTRIYLTRSSQEQKTLLDRIITW